MSTTTCPEPVPCAGDKRFGFGPFLLVYVIGLGCGALTQFPIGRTQPPVDVRPVGGLVEGAGAGVLRPVAATSASGGVKMVGFPVPNTAAAIVDVSVNGERHVLTFWVDPNPGAADQK